MNIFSFTAHFGSEEDCRLHFKEQRDKEGVVCKRCEGDVFSVRGKGKFVLQCIGETGRKGNIHITIKKYI